MLIIIIFIIQITISNCVNFYVNNNNNRIENILSCPQNKICTHINYCPDIVSLLNEAILPVHRFRQAVCGYVGINPKVCCNSPRQFENFYSNNNYNLKTECGKSLVKSNIVTLGSYPFIARIGFINLNNGNINYTCTGTIINERTILTTASCALETHQDYILHSVLLGEFNTNTNPDCNIIFCAHCTKSYNVSFVIKHPNYDPVTFARNIALIRLDESVSFTLTIQPICYSTRQTITIGSLSLLIGWGKISDDQDEIINEQRALPMKLLPIKDCTEYINKGINVEVCANGKQVPCSNFNGSPLIRRNGNTYELIGILSYSSTCYDNKNLPSVYINLQKYITWIGDNS